jgi:hypothetical protein
MITESLRKIARTAGSTRVIALGSTALVSRPQPTNNAFRNRRIIATTMLAATSALVASFIVPGATASAVADGDEGAYADCLNHWRDNHPNAHTDEVLFDCCISVGGVWSSNDWQNGDCILNDDAGWPGRPAPPPGAVVLPHPGDNQQLGPGQPPPPPSAVLPPDLNQTGIQ